MNIFDGVRSQMSWNTYSRLLLRKIWKSDVIIKLLFTSKRHPTLFSGFFLSLGARLNVKWTIKTYRRIVSGNRLTASKMFSRFDAHNSWERHFRPLQTRTHCCGHIVAHDVSWAAQTGKHLLRTQNVSEQNQKHFLCLGHKIGVRNKCCARANGETLVSATMCPQRCVLVCQGLYSSVKFKKIGLVTHEQE